MRDNLFINWREKYIQAKNELQQLRRQVDLSSLEKRHREAEFEEVLTNLKNENRVLRKLVRRRKEPVVETKEKSEELCQLKDQNQAMEKRIKRLENKVAERGRLIEILMETHEDDKILIEELRSLVDEGAIREIDNLRRELDEKNEEVRQINASIHRRR